MISYKKKAQARELILKELKKQKCNLVKPDWDFIKYLRNKYEISDL